MEEIYITGASGFLGTHLVKKLDDLPYNIATIPHEKISTTKLKPFDKFFFISTYGNMIFHTEDDKITQANISDLISILDQIDFKHGFKSFVFVSSSSVRRKVQTMYSRTKKAAEEILLAYMEKYNVPICIVRPLSITGVGDQKEHLIPTLIRSCLNGEKMDFVPDAYHDYIDVDDVAEGMLNLSRHSAKGIFELGTGKQYSNQQVREIVEKITGKKANVNIVQNMRNYDSKEWVSNNYKARMYGWLPKKSLEQSITEMVEEAKNASK